MSVDTTVLASISILTIIESFSSLSQVVGEADRVVLDGLGGGGGSGTDVVEWPQFLCSSDELWSSVSAVFEGVLEVSPVFLDSDDSSGSLDSAASVGEEVENILDNLEGTLGVLSAALKSKWDVKSVEPEVVHELFKIVDPSVLESHDLVEQIFGVLTSILA